MNRFAFTFTFLTAMLLSSVSHSRNDILDFNIMEAMNVHEPKIGNDIKFYFGDQPHPKVIKNFGEFKSNKKTNAFNKGDREACDIAFASALISLRDKARQLGANAVTGIKSNYQNMLTSSEKQFKCGAGKVIAGVALVGTVVSLEDK